MGSSFSKKNVVEDVEEFKQKKRVDLKIPLLGYQNSGCTTFFLQFSQRKTKPGLLSKTNTDDSRGIDFKKIVHKNIYDTTKKVVTKITAIDNETSEFLDQLKNKKTEDNLDENFFKQLTNLIENYDFITIMEKEKFNLRLFEGPIW